MIKTVLKFLTRLFKKTEYEADRPVLRDSHRAVVYVNVPDRVMSIACWHGLHYEVNTKTPLPNNCVDILHELKQLSLWRGCAKQYFTLHDWQRVFHSPNPKQEFIERIRKIESHHGLSC